MIFNLCGGLVIELDRVFGLHSEGKMEKEIQAGVGRPTARHDLLLVQTWMRKLFGALVWMWGLVVVAPVDGKAESSVEAR